MNNVVYLEGYDIIVDSNLLKDRQLADKEREYVEYR